MVETTRLVNNNQLVNNIEKMRQRMQQEDEPYDEYYFAKVSHQRLASATMILIFTWLAQPQ